MGIDFVRSRESHLTIAHDAVYRALYHVTEASSVSVGDRVLVELTNGSYEQCIVLSASPLRLGQYNPKHYVREDKLYRGTFIPEYLRDGTVYQGSYSDGTDGTSSGGTSSDGSGTSSETDNTGSGDNTGTGTETDDYSDMYNPCTCCDGCPHCKDCGLSMLGHLGYDHLYCHCHDGEDTSDDGEASDDGDVNGDGTGDDNSGSGDGENTGIGNESICSCRCVCLGYLIPYIKEVTASQSKAYPGDTVIFTVRLSRETKYDLCVFVSASDNVSQQVPSSLVFKKGDTELSFPVTMPSEDVFVAANYLGKTLMRTVAFEERTPAVLSLEAESPCIIGKPYTATLTLDIEAVHDTVVSITTDRIIIAPVKVVVEAGTSSVSFQFVPYDDATRLTAHLGESEVSCDISASEE